MSMRIIDEEMIELMDFVEEFEPTFPRFRRRVQDMDNPLERYTDVEFMMRFRFSKTTVCDALKRLLDCREGRDGRGLPVPPLLQLCCTLRFFATANFQEEYENQSKEVEFEKIQVFPCSSRVHSISWSPESNLRAAPKKILFAYSTADYLINVYSSNVTDAYTSKVLRGHSNYVNDISFNPRGNFLASGSDDLTCRIWLTEKNYEVLCKFYLRSPVVAVKWHHEDPGKVLVGEKNGVITFFNVTTETAIMSLRAATSPLMAVDWAPSNSQFVAAISGNQLVIWDVTNPSNASIEKVGHADGGLHVKFFPLNEQKLVSLGARENCLKVSYLHKPNNPFTVAKLKLATGLTFHQHLPYVCTGVDTNIYMFRLTV